MIHILYDLRSRCVPLCSDDQCDSMTADSNVSKATFVSQPLARNRSLQLQQ